MFLNISGLNHAPSSLSGSFMKLQLKYSAKILHRKPRARTRMKMMKIVWGAPRTSDRVTLKCSVCGLVVTHTSCYCGCWFDPSKSLIFCLFIRSMMIKPESWNHLCNFLYLINSYFILVNYEYELIWIKQIFSLILNSLLTHTLNNYVFWIKSQP